MSPASGLPDNAVATVVRDPVWIVLADGTRLCARIWLPADADTQPVPAILEFLPYRKDDVHALEDSTIHPYYAAAGYAAVRVDMRGSGDSDGSMGDEYSAQEHADALEVIDWISRQPWCTGAVGMTGISWSGFNSLQVAALRPPALKAIITACSTDDRYDNDVHYLGGVPLAYYMLPWASALMSFNVRPPDPEIVGERWRELWRERFDHQTDLVRLWMEHQSRDDYWRHGSIREDYGALDCAVMAVGGWADAYVDAIFRMMENLSVPRRALIGPWGHHWPQYGRPGPQIGFLQEAVRWWDHWLKGIDNGVMQEPMVRAWMQDAVAPAPDYAERPGRWVAEPSLPAPSVTARRLHLTAGGLSDAPDPQPAALAHCSPLGTGSAAGAWCAYGHPADLPTDQRVDDARSLSLDSAPLPEPLELLGSVAVGLEVSCDRPAAFVVARLCDVWPDGSSTLIARGVLNLCHHAGHDAPVALTPGEPIRVRIAMKSTAYAVPAGHRLRLALSTSYWPWLWPSPEPATITVATGAGSGSMLELPVRAPQPADAQLPEFGPAEQAPPLPVRWIREPAPSQTQFADPARHLVEHRVSRDFGGAREHPNGLTYSDHDPITMTIDERDPLSARVALTRNIEQSRPASGWRTRIALRSEMTADATGYLLTTTIDAYEKDTRVHSHTFTARVPRDHS